MPQSHGGVGRPVTAMRVRHGEGVLDLCGEEAAALGSRALVVSSHRLETRESHALELLVRVLRRVRVGHHPFPHVPDASMVSVETVGMAAEAARESRCRLVIGLGDREAMDVAREAAGRAMLPMLLLPTVVGYGDTADSERRPLPEVLIADARLSVGSPPGRTAELGLDLFAGLVERYAAQADGLEPGAEEKLVNAMSRLVDALPAAIKAPHDMGPRAGLAEATVVAAEGMQVAGRGTTVIHDWSRRLAPSVVGRSSVLAGLLPALLEAGSEGRGPLDRGRVAEIGRRVLDVRETDEGRAASWAAGGIRQWIVNLGLKPELPGAAKVRARADDEMQETLAAALR